MNSPNITFDPRAMQRKQDDLAQHLARVEQDAKHDRAQRRANMRVNVAMFATTFVLVFSFALVF